MLFKDKELCSLYDIEFDYEGPSLYSLSKEIYRMTDLINEKLQSKEEIKLGHKDNNNYEIGLSYKTISDFTFNRSLNEIKEILYRNNNEQFSISKGLRQIGLNESFEKLDDCNYLKLLYLFYMINYFVFPSMNIFKYISNDKKTFDKSFNEGTDGGKIISFILNNLLDNRDIFNYFISEQNDLSILSEQACEIINNLMNQDCENEINNVISQPYISKECNNDNPLIIILDNLYGYSMRLYCGDMIYNLIQQDIFKFDELLIRPSTSWKKLFIDINNIEEFLNNDDLYSFCKQKEFKKIESRDRTKFKCSNAVSFLKTIIAYDKNWIKEFNSNEGLFIRNEDGKLTIYALKIAIIIKTYNDLVNKNKMRIINEDCKLNKPLGSTLSTNCDNSFPAILPIRLFHLACHSQYLNAIKQDSYYEEFKKEFIQPEIISMEIFNKMFFLNSFNSRKLYLESINEKLISLLED